MIPVTVQDGELFNEYGEPVKPNENGFVEIEVEGKVKKFVAKKLANYLEREGQVYKKPILRRNKDGKVRFKKKYKTYIKNGKVGHHRRRRVIITDKEGNEQEYESITKAATELKICNSKMFRVLSGEKETLKGYKIKYAE